MSLQAGEVLPGLWRGTQTQPRISAPCTPTPTLRAAQLSIRLLLRFSWSCFRRRACWFRHSVLCAHLFDVFPLLFVYHHHILWHEGLILHRSAHHHVI